MYVMHVIKHDPFDFGVGVMNLHHNGFVAVYMDNDACGLIYFSFSLFASILQK